MSDLFIFDEVVGKRLSVSVNEYIYIAYHCRPFHTCYKGDGNSGAGVSVGRSGVVLRLAAGKQTDPLSILLRSSGKSPE